MPCAGPASCSRQQCGCVTVCAAPCPSIPHSRHPLTVPVCSFPSQLAAIVVFGCIKDKCYSTVCLEPFNTHPDTQAPGECHVRGLYCVFNNGGACGYSVGVGVVGFVLASLLVAQELLVPDLAGRRPWALAELACSTVWAFLWFLAFCWLTHSWRAEPHDWPVRVVNNAQAAVVFSLLSLVLWVRDGPDVVYACHHVDLISWHRVWLRTKAGSSGMVQRQATTQGLITTVHTHSPYYPIDPPSLSTKTYVPVCPCSLSLCPVPRGQFQSQSIPRCNRRGLYSPVRCSVAGAPK